MELILSSFTIKLWLTPSNPTWPKWTNCVGIVIVFKRSSFFIFFFFSCFSGFVFKGTDWVLTFKLFGIDIGKLAGVIFDFSLCFCKTILTALLNFLASSSNAKLKAALHSLF